MMRPAKSYLEQQEVHQLQLQAELLPLDDHSHNRHKVNVRW